MKIYYCDAVYYGTKAEAMAHAKKIEPSEPCGYVDEYTVGKLNKATVLGLANNRHWAVDIKTIYSWDRESE